MEVREVAELSHDCGTIEAMMMIRRRWNVALACAAVCVVCGSCRKPAAPPEETPPMYEAIFDGETLDGWEGDDRFWSVEDGCIVGRSSEEEPVTRNTFLIWQGEDVADFELRAEVQLQGNNNSGIQYRAAVLEGEGYRTTGYQCDLHPNPPYMGMLYEEGGRGIVAQQGSRIRIGPDGAKSEIEPAVEPIQFAPDEWHEVTVIARGHRLEHRIDDEVTVVVEDHEEGAFALRGVIALQLHAGQPYEVRFRNLRVRRLE